VPALEITSDAFEAGGAIPGRHTCDAEDVSPPLTVAGPTEETRPPALVVDDPEAAPLEGSGTVGYAGPFPPAGHGRHRYLSRLHAPDAELDLEPGADRDELERALDGHALEVAEVVGGYER
jgi:phosphatidylethanolamine-binding protein (PEBP) family uncharacterized protein